jgi:3-hydroxyisobutyrate dehydrogenase-like beta-hydroxyacid dehydrogenase
MDDALTPGPHAPPYEQVVGFIGAGRIGLPMVERLRGAGHEVRVFARRPDVRLRLAALGARPVETVEELGGCPIVVSCLFSDAQLAEVGPRLVPRLAPGSIVVSHTTGAPVALETLATLGAPAGVGVVEAPFSGSADDVLAGRLTVYLGGDGSTVDRAAAVVGAYADPVLRTGGPGTALRVKLLNNTLFGAISQLTLVAVAAAQAMGIEESIFLPALQAGSGGSRAAERITRLGGSTAFTERVGEFLRKDVAAAAAVAESLGVDIGPLLRAATDGPIQVEPPAEPDKALTD